MATTVNMTSKKADGKEVTRAITYINPDASDNQVSSFVVALASLSDNELTNVEKVTKTDLEIPEE